MQTSSPLLVLIDILFGWPFFINKNKKDLQRRGYADPSFGQPVGQSVTEKTRSDSTRRVFAAIWQKC